MDSVGRREVYVEYVDMVARGVGRRRRGNFEVSTLAHKLSWPSPPTACTFLIVGYPD